MLKEPESGSGAATTDSKTTTDRLKKLPPDRKKASAEGLRIARVFSTEGQNPFDQLEWETRKASITDDKEGH